MLARRIKNSGRVPDGVRVPGHLAWVRGFFCIAFASGKCEGRIEAAHVDHAGDKGMGRKVADRHAVPMCSHHHAIQHRIGWRTFEARYGIKALAEAEKLARVSPHRGKWA